MHHDTFATATRLIMLLLGGLMFTSNSTAWTFSTRANASFSSFNVAEIQQGQSELNLFIDTVNLDRYGAGVGYIRQDQGLDGRDDLVNDILHLNAWYSWYPEMLPGRLSVTLNYYDGSESFSSSSGGGSGNPNPGNPNPGNDDPGPGDPGNTDPGNTDQGGNTDPGNTDPGTTDPGNTDPGNTSPRAAKPSSVTITNFTDSLTIINPVIAFMNYDKTLYVDFSYAASEYEASDAAAGDLEVKQYSPAIGLGVNEQYDWLQLRLFYIDLSTDTRTPGTSDTLAAHLGWTHWFKSPQPLAAEKFNTSLLLGERLYAVDADARKIYNLTDMQTGSVMFGMHWKKNETTELYVYSGYEQYRDVANDDDYNSIFIYIGISNQW